MLEQIPNHINYASFYEQIKMVICSRCFFYYFETRQNILLSLENPDMFDDVAKKPLD